MKEEEMCKRENGNPLVYRVGVTRRDMITGGIEGKEMTEEREQMKKEKKK